MFVRHDGACLSPVAHGNWGAAVADSDPVRAQLKALQRVKDAANAAGIHDWRSTVSKQSIEEELNELKRRGYASERPENTGSSRGLRFFNFTDDPVVVSVCDDDGAPQLVGCMEAGPFDPATPAGQDPHWATPGRMAPLGQCLQIRAGERTEMFFVTGESSQFIYIMPPEPPPAHSAEPEPEPPREEFHEAVANELSTFVVCGDTSWCSTDMTVRALFFFLAHGNCCGR